jgi:hypothetical protein
MLMSARFLPRRVPSQEVRGTARMVFGGWIICPEQFVKISLNPGESRKWVRTYKFQIN